jgi:hypothetical protein
MSLPLKIEDQPALVTVSLIRSLVRPGNAMTCDGGALKRIGSSSVLYLQVMHEKSVMPPSLTATQEWLHLKTRRALMIIFGLP